MSANNDSKNQVETGAPADEKKAGLGYWAERVLEEAEKASEDFASDPVHDLRVAIRRCRSLADGFLSVDPDPAWRQMKKLGKELFTSLGDLRDTHVMMEWIAKLSAEDDPLREVLLTSLRQKEGSLKLAARESMKNFDGERWMTLNRKLAERATRVPLEGPVFQYLALERWHEAHELHRTALRNRSAVAFHQLRIGIKRFRYTVENFLPERHKRWSRDLRDLQDALGEVHDFDVLWGLVKSHPEVGTEERALWQRTIASERLKRINLYRKQMVGRQSLWQKWRAELPSGDALAEAALEKMRTWATFHDPDDKHVELVTRLALEIFDGLAREGVLPESEPARRILEAAAVMHDVGRDKDRGGHRKRGYRKIRSLSTARRVDRRIPAERCHRGALSPRRIASVEPSDLCGTAGSSPYRTDAVGWSTETRERLGRRTRPENHFSRGGAALRVDDDLCARTDQYTESIWGTVGAGPIPAGKLYQDAHRVQDPFPGTQVTGERASPERMTSDGPDVQYNLGGGAVVFIGVADENEGILA